MAEKVPTELFSKDNGLLLSFTGLKPLLIPVVHTEL